MVARGWCKVPEALVFYFSYDGDMWTHLSVERKSPEFKKDGQVIGEEVINGASALKRQEKLLYMPNNE